MSQKAIRENPKKFHYSAYWRTWNRVFPPSEHRQGTYCFVEMTLTPINSDWAHVGEQRIRLHSTDRDPRDRDADELPDNIVEEMARALGPELTARMLDFDYMRNIDWATYNREKYTPRNGVTGGGVPFDCCCQVAPTTALE